MMRHKTNQLPDQSLNQTSDLRPALCPVHQLRNLKKLQHLDLSMNSFTCVPDCVVGMPMLEWLDMGGNHLQHLPEDIHRCESSAATCSSQPITLFCFLSGWRSCTRCGCRGTNWRLFQRTSAGWPVWTLWSSAATN